MKKIILAVLLLSALLVGCGKPKVYGDIIDYSQYEDADFHVKFAMSRYGCYSDGSFMSNLLYKDWLERFEH